MTAEQSRPPDDPHADGEILTAGAPPIAAEAAVVLLHGRGDSAQHILRLIDEFHHHGVMYLAPEAEGRRWYPWSFLADPEENEPWLSSALALVSRTLDVAGEAGVNTDRTLLFGFSQGASLAAEYSVRHPTRYGGVAAIAGGLLGPDLSAREVGGSLNQTPIFLGCGSDDPHVPSDRMTTSAAVFESLDGDVTHRIYDGLGHAINDDEMNTVDSLIADFV